jgi:PTS system beta-glucosides-specific IIA component
MHHAIPSTANEVTQIDGVASVDGNETQLVIVFNEEVKIRIFLMLGVVH